ncbi:LOW QUALITY PROTEIN: ZBED1-like protein [Mya arenaria]|uniref:ZBED1-like protein n=1 Tax=Mya arenaria TaxID=6604 RepID=A0ABY7DMY9_MYAAR|nr:LOW QUALITY PROTEIN: ZBED1-like protein [Mya arenaria]
MLCAGKKYANKGNTTNLAFHLDHDHKGNMTDRPETSKPVLVQQKIHTYNTGTVQPRMKIDDILLQLIVNKILPLSLVENQYFVKLLGLLDARYAAPGRKKLESMLEKKMAEIKAKVVAGLKECDSISITHDGWTSLYTESYSTITGHFITGGWELPSGLATTKVVGSHTAENISQTLEKAQSKRNLPEPIATMQLTRKKAVELLGWTRFECYGHRINLVVRNSLKEPTVSRLVGKGRKLVTSFHQSSSANDLLMAKQLLLGTKTHKLIMDVPTRWNSTHMMLERLIKQTAPLLLQNDNSLNKNATSTIKSYSIGFDEQGLAEKVVELLKPFLNSTTSVSSEKEPTMHKVIPILYKIAKIVTVSDTDPNPVKQMKIAISCEMEKRTTDKDICLLLACILNPFTKDLGFLTPEELYHRAVIQRGLT